MNCQYFDVALKGHALTALVYFACPSHRHYLITLKGNRQNLGGLGNGLDIIRINLSLIA